MDEIVPANLDNDEEDTGILPDSGLGSPSLGPDEDDGRLSEPPPIPSRLTKPSFVRTQAFRSLNNYTDLPNLHMSEQDTLEQNNAGSNTVVGAVPEELSGLYRPNRQRCVCSNCSPQADSNCKFRNIPPLPSSTLQNKANLLKEVSLQKRRHQNMKQSLPRHSVPDFSARSVPSSLAVHHMPSSSIRINNHWKSNENRRGQLTRSGWRHLPLDLRNSEDFEWICVKDFNKHGLDFTRVNRQVAAPPGARSNIELIDRSINESALGPARLSSVINRQPSALNDGKHRPSPADLGLVRADVSSKSQPPIEKMQPSALCGRCGKCHCASCVSRRDLPSVSCCGTRCRLSADCCVETLSCLCLVHAVCAHCQERYSADDCTDEENTNNCISHGACAKAKRDTDDAVGCLEQMRLNACSLDGSSSCLARFTCLALTSLCLPCLCCYWPFRCFSYFLTSCYNVCCHTNGCRCNNPISLDSTKPSPVTSSALSANTSTSTDTRDNVINLPISRTMCSNSTLKRSNVIAHNMTSSSRVFRKPHPV